jgi:hypothetical protein
LGCGGFLGLVVLGLIVLVGMKVGHLLEGLAPKPDEADIAVHRAKLEAERAKSPQQAIKIVVHAFGAAATVDASCRLLTTSGKREEWGGMCGHGLDRGSHDLKVESITLLGSHRARAKAKDEQGRLLLVDLRSKGNEWLVESEHECEQGC